MLMCIVDKLDPSANSKRAWINLDKITMIEDYSFVIFKNKQDITIDATKIIFDDKSFIIVKDFELKHLTTVYDKEN